MSKNQPRQPLLSMFVFVRYIGMTAEEQRWMLRIVIKDSK